MSNPADWVGRKVKRYDNCDDWCLGAAIVLAVDDTAYAPSAWIKYPSLGEGNPNGRDYPAYRSIDLSDLRDIETDEEGPRWGSDKERVNHAPLPPM